MPDPERSFLSVCSGAGGLDLGLEAAGWGCVGQVEIDRDCADTLRARRGGDAVFHAGIEDIDPRGLRRTLGFRCGELGLLAGGPPCQPFTTHGLRQALRDERAEGIWPAFLGFVEEFEPGAVLIENVDGLLSASLSHVSLRERAGRALEPFEMKGSFLKWLLGRLDKLGYACSWGVLEAADFGVPQFRQRAFVLGVRGRMPCPLPEGDRGVRRTVRDAIAGLADPGPVQPLSARKRAIYDLVPEGGNWRDLPPGMQEETMGAAFVATGGKSGWWRRLTWDRPAPTILGMPDHSSTGLIHPAETRCLGLVECAVLQSFPANARFAGSSRSGYQQVGNAVPPRLGQAVGAHLSTFLEERRFVRPPEPDWRKESANRRIGTHGWLVRGDNRPVVSLLAKLREDSVWRVAPDDMVVEQVAAHA